MAPRITRSILGAQHVARTADRVDELPIRATVDRLAQPADVYVDEVALRVKVKVPDALEQHGARDDLARTPHEEFEELQLTRRQLDLTSTAGDPAGEKIEVQVRHLELRGIRHAGASAGECFDAREKLDERERLGQIVV